MSEQLVRMLTGWRTLWRAIQSKRLDPRWHLDSRLAALTLLNLLLYRAWYLMRQAFDAGEHHHAMVLILMVLTLLMWIGLIRTVVDRINLANQPSQGGHKRQ
jgi:hypothetical protein